MLGGAPTLRSQKEDEDKREKKWRSEIAGESRKCCVVLYCENQGSQNCEEISKQNNPQYKKLHEYKSQFPYLK